MKKIVTILITLALTSVGFANLIQNGDFEAGNIDFTTEYYFSPPASMYDPATYVVGTSPRNYHSSWADYGDHTSGSGNMLIVNAACDDTQPTPGVEVVWQQTVSVTPNTDYVFTYWLSSSYHTNLANIECSINGSAIGTQLAPSTVKVWEEVSYSWNSGSNTSVTITLEDLTRAYSGDDFAIDDIRFYSPIIPVDIDIKPGSYPNSINLGSKGVIPVAILSSEDFDATTVDPETVALGGAGVAVRGKGNKYMAHEEDVNGDGLVDLVLQVETENLDPNQFQGGLATLTGETYDGLPFEGSDEITIVPPEK